MSQRIELDERARCSIDAMLAEQGIDPDTVTDVVVEQGSTGLVAEVRFATRRFPFRFNPDWRSS